MVVWRRQRVELSNVYVVNNLYVSGSIFGNLTGSLSGSSTGGSSGGSGASTSVLFTKIASPVSVGDIVSLSSTGLAKCSKTNDLLSNAIGIVQTSGSGQVYVQTSGESTVTVAGTYSTGSILYAGNSGGACTYDQIGSGEYITQVGIASGNGVGKLIIQPRIFGQKG